jgi:hypothetical protein
MPINSSTKHVAVIVAGLALVTATSYVGKLAYDQNVKKKTSHGIVLYPTSLIRQVAEQDGTPPDPNLGRDPSSGLADGTGSWDIEPRTGSSDAPPQRDPCIRTDNSYFTLTLCRK